MTFRRPRTGKINRKSVFNILIFSLLLYFVFHSIYGSRGVIAYFKLQSELTRMETTLASLHSDRLEIENRTKLLRPGSLDRDMLDEKVRTVLGVAAKSERVFKTDHKDSD